MFLDVFLHIKSKVGTQKRGNTKRRDFRSDSSHTDQGGMLCGVGLGCFVVVVVVVCAFFVVVV